MRRSVAVVDDNKLTRLLVSDALRDLGYEPIPYASAAEAIAGIELEPPCACIVDHGMPAVSGSEFIRTLRRSSDKRLRSIPVIGLSGGFARELLAAGATTCLKKPFSQVGLSQALESALSGEPSGREASRGGNHASDASAAGAPHGAGASARARRAARVVVDFEMEIRSRCGVERTRTVDLSAGGFAVRMREELRADETIEFSFPGRELAGKARVVQSARVEPGLWRIGFEFKDMMPAQQKRAELLIIEAVLGHARDGR